MLSKPGAHIALAFNVLFRRAKYAGRVFAWVMHLAGVRTSRLNPLEDRWQLLATWQSHQLRETGSSRCNENTLVKRQAAGG